MRAFNDIYAMGNANLATVAKPISEALIATAFGLFGCHPGGGGLQLLRDPIRVLDSEMSNFSSDFLNIVEAPLLQVGATSMASTGGSGRQTLTEINVTPLVDVMLVLLIIFMVTAPLIQQGVKVRLPEAKAQPVRSRGGEAGPLGEGRRSIWLGRTTNPPASPSRIPRTSCGPTRGSPGITSSTSWPTAAFLTVTWWR